LAPPQIWGFLGADRPRAGAGAGFVRADSLGAEAGGLGSSENLPRGCGELLETMRPVRPGSRTRGAQTPRAGRPALVPGAHCPRRRHRDPTLPPFRSTGRPSGRPHPAPRCHRAGPGFPRLPARRRPRPVRPRRAGPPRSRLRPPGPRPHAHDSRSPSSAGDRPPPRACGPPPPTPSSDPTAWSTAESTR